jgi:diadenosine tetraphosphatase ApaH/serine/threonine PP2A family protein phosphatase
MKAILSDIHGNLEALHAVLVDMESFGVEDIYCLGDILGYGPNPRECVGLAMEWDVCLMGNHDEAALHGAPHYHSAPAAQRALQWSIREIEAPIPTKEDAKRRLAFLADMPHSYQDDDHLFVHGSPRKPLTEYIFPEDIYNPRKMDPIFDLINCYCFVGHTHLPGIFTADRQCLPPEGIDNVYRLDGRKTLCNVGSVGQPRDGDWRACYVLLDGKTIRFRRVDYDVDTTVGKIKGIDGGDDFFGERLRGGR